MIYEIINPYLPNLLIILAVFTVGVASPGPATLMILGVAMSRGRAQAVALSLGIISGSAIWACVAALGFVAALETSAVLFGLMKIVGAMYLLYIIYKSLRSALRNEPFKIAKGTGVLDLRGNYLRGLLLHITIPKAPLVWLATLSIGLGDSAPASFLIVVTIICQIVALTVFVGYAYLFSTRTASSFYLSFRRPFEYCLGALFGAGALKILTLRSN